MNRWWQPFTITDQQEVHIVKSIKDYAVTLLAADRAPRVYWAEVVPADTDSKKA